MAVRTRSSTAKASTTTSTADSKRGKRKTSEPEDDHNEEQPSKRPRTSTATESSDAPIIINRAPVLELWGACVAHATNPELSWPVCLSIGSSIATITAISKGRSIGTVAQPNEDSKKGNTNKSTKENTLTVKVMDFPITLKDNAVIVKGKKKTASEESLTAKFGPEAYTRVKQTMEESLNAWRESEDDLNSKAFHMYEQFRPDVAKGQKGWGRKGELHLSKIKEAVSKK